MSDEARKEVLIKTGEQHPSLLLEIIEQEAPHLQGGFHPLPGGESPSWCSCLKCRDMPTQIERVCCGRPPNQCQSQLPDFRLLILDELVLTIVQMYRQDVLALPQDEDYNKGKRYAAYRQFILWHHGRLGVGVRRVIPSCVWSIRDKYPDQYGQYVSLIPSRLG
ncbi:P2X purinoceptor 7-like [Saccostrea echinata]|uniref:P2X purinoceptor 7-like n=1 Tax=Saccostrea echinata TaxID=191078 RepID=UPI002A80A6D3|nr:P2X purinoceptor 7-like [Saccostrea echinata]